MLFVETKSKAVSGVFEVVNGCYEAIHGKGYPLSKKGKRQLSPLPLVKSVLCVYSVFYHKMPRGVLLTVYNSKTTIYNPRHATHGFPFYFLK